MYYTIIGILALIIVAVINHDVIRDKAKLDLVQRRYRSFLIVVYAYIVVDVLWGILDQIGNIPLLYLDTFVYHQMVALSILFWCRYVVAYLNPPKALGKVLIVFGYLFLISEFIALIVNVRNPLFFWFDEEGTYRTGIIREVVLRVQIALYSIVAVLSFIFYLKVKKRTRNRFLAISIFSMLMNLAIIIQIGDSYIPLYTIGLLLGICILHVFVHEDEKNEITKQIEENTDIIANAGYGIWKIRMVSKGRHRMIADETLQKILGIEGMGLSPEDLYTFYHSRLMEDVEGIENNDYASMKKGEIRTRTLRWDHPTKGIIHLYAGGRSYITEENEEVISGFCADVTATKRKEKRSDLVIKSLARSYQFMAYILLKDFTYETYNWHMNTTQEVKEKYAKGVVNDQLFADIETRISPAFREEMQKFADLSTINERMQHINVLVAQFKDINDVWQEWSYIVADRNEDGSVRTLIWAIRQIEDEKRAELRRKRLLADNIAANKAKTVFLQNMSHEIRTPLNALYGFAQLLSLPDGTWSNEEREQYTRYIHNSYNLLDMLIGDIIDIADSEHGNYRINISEVNINQICSNAIMAVEFRKPGDVKMHFTSDLPDDYTIQSDGRRIQQVLINYLTNACKHTKKGEIHLDCSTTENPGKLTFSVTDTGEGIPADKADVIFNRFTKLDQFSQGSGLGLNICLMIAEKLGGSVYLDKSYTKGARFIFEIDDKS